MVEIVYAEEVSDNDINLGMIWYIPYHNVRSPNKPDKVRIIFDCAATYDNVSLNHRILHRLDLTNFRQHPIAVMGGVR